MFTKQIAGIALFLLISSASLFSAGLKDIINQADYLIITTEAFRDGTEELASWRRNEGFTVRTVTIPEIQADFPNEQLSGSIREFISYTLTYWTQPKPRYILLAGGVAIVPPFRVAGEFDEDSVSVDGYYAINLNQDDMDQDVSLGRLPFKDGTELANMIGKIKTFENPENKDRYKTDFFITADSGDYGYLEQFAEKLAEETIPSYLRVDRLYLAQGTQYSGTKADYINKLNDGTYYLINIFHANPRVWARGMLLSSAEINPGNIHGAPAINLMIGCSQDFDSIQAPSIIEKMMSLENSGLVASYASVGMNYAQIAYKRIQDFLKSAIYGAELRIGDVIATCPKETNIQEAKYLLRLTLLGDPAMKLPQWAKAPVEDDNSAAGDIALDLSPNPFSEFVNVKIAIGSENRVLLELYDLLGNRIAELNNSVLQPGNYSFPWHSNGSGAVICRLTAGNSVVSKMVVCIR